MKQITLIMLLTISMLLISLSGKAQSPKTYSSSGTFTVPAGVTTVTAQAWGGGGKGGTRTNNGNGGGGGGGAYASSAVTVNALNAPYTITVGLGSSTTTAGEDSWFSTTGTVMAKGGQSVANNTAAGATGGLASASVGTTKFNGGNGITGTLTYGGGGGSSAGTGNAGNNGGLLGAGGNAPTNGGNGGNGRSGSQGDGNPGSTPGGGGGGGYRTGGTTNRNGGNGGNGQVMISWACSTYSLTTTSIASPLCITNGAVVTLNGGAGLPIGNYTVSYTLTGTNTGSNTATMSVTTAGTGSFTTVTLNNIGLTNIQITNLSSGVAPDNCSNAITTNNTASVTLISTPSQPSTITGNVTFCGGTSQSYSVTNVAGVTYNWTFPAGWVQTAGGTTNTITVTTNGNSGNVSVTPSNSCGTGTVRNLAVTSNAPTVNAGSALATICQGGTTVALGGSFGGTATGAIWSDGGIGGTFTNNSGSTPGTATWTPPGSYLGTATLTLTSTGGSCGTTNTTKTQTVSTGSTATVGSTMTITGSLTSTSLGGNTPSVGSGLWTLISGPTGTVTFSNASSGSSTATVPSIGTYVFRWTVTNSCGTSFADITVNYFSITNHRDYTLFYEDFDASNGGWTNTTSTNGSWLWTDSFPGVSEIGENSFWRTNNFNDYANNAVLEITSPVYNFSGYENLLFNIDIRYDTQQDTDGMRILYSINNGAFVQLGATGSGVNWYNSNTVSALGSNGWSNNNATAALAFTPIGVGANRFIRATTLLADGIFRNQSNVRFKVEFRSNGSTTDNGVAFDNVAVEGDPIVALVASPIAPANINQNLRLWFKSNAGISATDGTALTAWEDQAFDTSRADLVNKESVKALATDAPTYRDNAARNINFNPVVDFNAANKDYMNGKGGLYSQDYFVVVFSDNLVENTMGTTVRQIPLGGKSSESSFHEDPTGLGLGNTTARYSPAEVISHSVGDFTNGTGSPSPSEESYGRAFTSSTVTYNEPMIINVKTNATGTKTEIYKNGIKIDNTDGKTGNNGDQQTLNFCDYKNLPFYIGTGRSGISGRPLSVLNGRLSEVIAYTSPNSDLNQQKIQSYLGIKYGITLHATGSTNASGVSLTTRLNDINYIDSAENIIWNTTSNTGYNYDIAVIGRDDNSQLYQKQSKTVNTTDDITIGLTEIAATNNLNTSTCNDRNFLAWGNNNGTLAAQPAVIVNMSTGIAPALTTNVEFVSIGRTWKVVETGGDMPTTKVSIPTTMLSATLTPPGDYLMFVSNTPAFDPTAEYRVMTVNGSNLETSYDFDGTKYITFGFAPERTFVRSIAFDGTNDYLDAGKVLNLNTSFTVSAWVKRNSTNQTILSKRDNTFTTGYDLSINSSGRAEMRWRNGAMQTITSTVAIPSGIWHNIAVTFNGTTARLYIDGVLNVTQTMPTVPSNNQSFLIAAADGVNPTSFFNGNIDEVRVWNVALTDRQLRYVMNQEILSNGLTTNGSIVPNTITQNDISSIPWSNLSAYYPMSTYTYTNAKDISVNNYTAALVNLTTVDRQTAPLPYESASNGQWQTSTTWLNNTVQYLPNTVSIIDGTTPINWNIVRTNHNISSTGNKDLLALFVNSNTITASNDSKVEVTHYLKLDGKIDLEGKSQLVQITNSDLDPTSAGSIERDQQGTANIYNYNYWSSPVGAINTTSNNNAYTVSGMMKDGTTATPQNITWTTSYNGSNTSPITLSSYWIYKFQNLTPLYANWQSVGISGSLNAGQGYTLKGSGAVGNQNYTFVGKPNNGTITSSIAPNNLNLSGNPYASAIDANQFILDNGSSTTGTIYFWEHASNNLTHVTAGYQGGYSARNITGGVAPVAPAGITGLGTSVKIPNRYIPVGQGFFVSGSATGGAVSFNNGQRLFIKEDNATLSNPLFRSAASSILAVDHFNDNSEDEAPVDNFKRIRLGYKSTDNFYKQALLGFMETNATNNIDYGYDAINIDSQANDLYFQNSGKILGIQGVGFFDINAIFPIGIKNSTAGNVTFKIDQLQNFTEDFEIFIYDNQTNIYHNVESQDVVLNVPQGTINDRFSLRFRNEDTALGNDDFNLSNGIQIVYTNQNSTLNIKNYVVDTTVESVALFNLLGQAVGTWDVENQNQQDIQLPIAKLSTGTYIVKVITDKGETSRKIIF